MGGSAGPWSQGRHADAGCTHAVQGFMSFDLKDVGNGDFAASQTYVPASRTPPSCAPVWPLLCRLQADVPG